MGIFFFFKAEDGIGVVGPGLGFGRVLSRSGVGGGDEGRAEGQEGVREGG